MRKWINKKLSDEALMAKYAYGSTDAFEHLYLRNKGGVFSLKAIMKFKYKARMVDGNPVSTDGQRYMFTYKWTLSKHFMSWSLDCA